MKEYEKSVVPIIESCYDDFTTVEKTIADFFISNNEELDFASKSIAGKLYISEASLSRFAKKLGYSGYREFIYNYQENFMKEEVKIEEDSKEVLYTYQELLNKSYTLIDNEQIRRVTRLISRKKRVYVYGMGSSGLAAQEFKMRFMRIGVDVESITDAHLLTMNSVRIHEDCLVIGISISGTTKEVITALERAKEKGAVTILVTSKNSNEYVSKFDEVILASVKKNLEYGNVISPQFPILIIMDIIYANYIQEDRNRRQAIYDVTLNDFLDR